MHSPELLFDVMRYGMAFSALTLALVLWGYGRGGVGRGYGLMSLAMVLVAVRYVLLLLFDWLPAVQWFVEIEPVLRALLLAAGLQRFADQPIRSHAIPTLLTMVAWLVVARWLDVPDSLRAFPAALMLVVACHLRAPGPRSHRTPSSCDSSSVASRSPADTRPPPSPPGAALRRQFWHRRRHCTSRSLSTGSPSSAPRPPPGATPQRNSRRWAPPSTATAFRERASRQGRPRSTSCSLSPHREDGRRVRQEQRG